MSNKVLAIQDHGYMKQDRSSFLGDGYCEGLGVLTPASSPPLPSPTKTEAYHKYIAGVNSSQTQQQGTVMCDN